MAGRLKLESVKLLACLTSLSLQLQKNYFLDRVIKRFSKQINGRPRSISYKPWGSDLLCKFIEIILWHELSPVNLQYIFQNTFLQKHFYGTACEIYT